MFAELAGTMEEISPEEKIKEKIKFNTEVLRLCMVGILTIGGGTVSLIDQGVFNGRRNFIIACGFILLIVLMRFSYSVIKTINNTIK